MDFMSVAAIEDQDMNNALQQPTETAVTGSATALPYVDDLSCICSSPTALGLLDGIIFWPGSAYLAHSTLRSHPFHKINAGSDTIRNGTPEPPQDDKIEAPCRRCLCRKFHAIMISAERKGESCPVGELGRRWSAFMFA